MTDGIEYRSLDSAELAQWDALVGEAPDGTAYHSSKWLSAISCATDNSIQITGFFSQGQLIAGIPVQKKHKGPFSLANRAFATPYASLLKSAGLDTKTEEALHRATHRFLKSFSVVALTGSPFGHPAQNPADWEQKEKATYLLDISSSEKVWAELGSPLHTKIRQAYRCGINVSSSCDPNVFLNLYLHTFSKQGLKPPISRSGFFRMLETIESTGIGKTYLASTAEGIPCVARLVIWDSKRAYFALLGSDFTITKARASELLTWEVIKDLAMTHKELDFVGANIPGVTEFKRKFRGTLRRYEEWTHYRSIPEKYFHKLFLKWKSK
jgi:hypothetical protein